MNFTNSYCALCYFVSSLVELFITPSVHLTIGRVCMLINGPSADFYKISYNAGIEPTLEQLFLTYFT